MEIRRSSYLHNGISYTGKMSSLYWIRALVIIFRTIYDFHQKGYRIWRRVIIWINLLILLAISNVWCIPRPNFPDNKFTDVFMNIIYNMCLDITLLKLLSHLTGANELIGDKISVGWTSAALLQYKDTLLRNVILDLTLLVLRLEYKQ